MIKDTSEVPGNSLELVQWLEELYPDKIVTRELSSYEQGYQNGVIDLIRMLKIKLESEDS